MEDDEFDSSDEYFSSNNIPAPPFDAATSELREESNVTFINGVAVTVDDGREKIRS